MAKSDYISQVANDFKSMDWSENMSDNNRETAKAIISHLEDWLNDCVWTETDSGIYQGGTYQWVGQGELNNMKINDTTQLLANDLDNMYQDGDMESMDMNMKIAQAYCTQVEQAIIMGILTIDTTNPAPCAMLVYPYSPPLAANAGKDTTNINVITIATTAMAMQQLGNWFYSDSRWDNCETSDDCNQLQAEMIADAIEMMINGITFISTWAGQVVGAGSGFCTSK